MKTISQLIREELLEMCKYDWTSNSFSNYINEVLKNYRENVIEWYTGADEKYYRTHSLKLYYYNINYALKNNMILGKINLGMSEFILQLDNKEIDICNPKCKLIKN